MEQKLCETKQISTLKEVHVHVYTMFIEFTTSTANFFTQHVAELEASLLSCKEKLTTAKLRLNKVGVACSYGNCILSSIVCQCQQRAAHRKGGWTRCHGNCYISVMVCVIQHSLKRTRNSKD